MPVLPTQSQKTDSIGVSLSNGQSEEQEDLLSSTTSKWEDDEERKFYEDIQDLKDFVPKSILGLDEKDEEDKDAEAKEKERKEREEIETKKLEEELNALKLSESEGNVEGKNVPNGSAAPAVTDQNAVEENDDEG